MKKKMTKKSKVALASTLTFAGIAAVVGGVYAVTDYFVNYAVMRPEPNAEEDTRAPSYDKSEVERENIAKSDAKVADWQAHFPPEQVYLQSFDDLKLSAFLYENPEPSHLWVVAVHGYQSDHTSVEDYGEEYFSRDYNVLIPDLRGHGYSQGDYIGMGYHDSQDILSWLDFILEKDPKAQIVLHGQSMGAATVMITAGQESLPEAVFAVIEDCGYTDSYQMMVEQLDYRYGLPPFPLMPLTNKMAESRTNYDLREASPLEFLKNATVPILFIHGSTDTFVLPYMLDVLYDSYEGEKEKLLVAGADHVASRNVDYQGYYTTVFDFLHQYQVDVMDDGEHDVEEKVQEEVEGDIHEEGEDEGDIQEEALDDGDDDIQEETEDEGDEDIQEEAEDEGDIDNQEDVQEEEET